VLQKMRGIAAVGVSAVSRWARYPVELKVAAGPVALRVAVDPVALMGSEGLNALVGYAGHVVRGIRACREFQNARD